jgi:TolA-binding protein
LGELHHATDDLEKARQSFVQVVTLYPGHAKVPDALYKLGKVYHQLGDTVRARDYLDRVIKNHPGTVGDLAKSYAAEYL